MLRLQALQEEREKPITLFCLSVNRFLHKHFTVFRMKHLIKNNQQFLYKYWFYNFHQLAYKIGLS